MDFESRKMYRW